MNKLLVTATSMIALLSAADASVTIQFEFEALRDAAGFPMTVPGVAVLIADSNGDGLLPTPAELFDATLSEYQLVGGTTSSDADTIIYAGLTDSSPAPGNFNGTASSLDLASLGLADGDIFGVFWFPSLGSLGTKVPVGAQYGMYQNSNIDQAVVDLGWGATRGMTIPSEPNTERTQFYDTSVILAEGVETTINTPSIANFTASLTVIPEPTTLTLSALALVALLRRRRY